MADPFSWSTFLTGLAISTASFVGQQLLRRPDRRGAALQDFDFNTLPVAEQGEPIPIVFGTGRIQPLNTLGRGVSGSSPINEKRKRNIFGGHFNAQVGHRYFLTIGLGVCMGEIDAVGRVWIDSSVIHCDRTFFQSNPTTIEIHKPGFFGEVGRGGGVYGDILVYKGTSDQPVDAILAGIYGDDFVPKYNNLCWVLFKVSANPRPRPFSKLDLAAAPPDFEWGEHNRLPAVSIEVFRFPNPLELSSNKVVTQVRDESGTYLGEVEDANPANVIYEILTNRIYGRKVNPADIDIESFKRAGEVLLRERHGYSNVLQGNIDTESVITSILRQIDAFLFQGCDGKTKLKLIREVVIDTETDLVSISEDDIIGDPTISMVNTDNEISQYKVRFADPLLEHNTNVAVQQDDAHTAAIGQVRTEEEEFEGVTNLDLANRIATRQLNALTTPLLQVRATVPNDTFGVTPMEPGRPFRFSFLREGIGDMLMRGVGVSINNSATHPAITVIAIQDRFFVDYALFDSGEEDVPAQQTPAPQMLAEAHAFELPRFFMRSLVPDSPEETSFLYIARSTDSNTTGVSFGINNEFDVDGLLTHGASLVGIVGKTTNTLQLTNFIGATQPVSDNSDDDIRVGNHLIMINGELLSWRLANTDANGVTTLHDLERGLLDTQPQEHAAGDRVWFLGFEEPNNMGTLVFSNDAQVQITATPNNAFADGPATTITHGIQNRAKRPFLPVFTQGVRNGVAYSYNEVDPVVSFIFKNRTHLSNKITFRSDPDETPVSGTMIHFSYMNAAGNVIETAPIPLDVNKISINFQEFGTFRDFRCWTSLNGLFSNNAVEFGDIDVRKS